MFVPLQPSKVLYIYTNREKTPIAHHINMDTREVSGHFTTHQSGR